MKKIIFIFLIALGFQCHAEDSINIESVFASGYCNWLQMFERTRPVDFHLILWRDKSNHAFIEFEDVYTDAIKRPQSANEIINWQGYYVVEGPVFDIKDEQRGEKIRQVAVNLNELCATNDWKRPAPSEFISSIQNQAYEELTYSFKKKASITTLLMEDVYLGMHNFHIYDPETKTLLRATISYAASKPNKVDVYFDEVVCRDPERCPESLKIIERLQQKQSQNNAKPVEMGSEKK